MKTRKLQRLSNKERIYALRKQASNIRLCKLCKNNVIKHFTDYFGRVSTKEKGVDITPVWNKSFREHQIIGSTQLDVKAEAKNAVESLNWKNSYFIDADHINLDSVDLFIESSDFFTIDVAKHLNKKTDSNELNKYIHSCSDLVGEIKIPGIDKKYSVSDAELIDIGNKYLFAVNNALTVYQMIEQRKGKGNFVIEISMDEVDKPQHPIELLFILKMLADKKVPVNSIAPKFVGKFNKGIDYEGDIQSVANDFEEALLIFDYSVQTSFFQSFIS